MKKNILKLAKNLINTAEYDLDKLILAVQSKLSTDVSYKLLRSLLVPLFEENRGKILLRRLESLCENNDLCYSNSEVNIWESKKDLNRSKKIETYYSSSIKSMQEKQCPKNYLIESTARITNGKLEPSRCSILLERMEKLGLVESYKIPDTPKLMTNLLNSKKVLDKFDKRIADNELALKTIADYVSDMAWEISVSEKGTRGHATIWNDNAANLEINTSTKSTFPDYLQQIYNNQGTAKKFYGSIRKGKGKYWDEIVAEALSRIYNGYQNAHGYDSPLETFPKILDNKIDKVVDKKDYSRIKQVHDPKDDYLPF